MTPKGETLTAKQLLEREQKTLRDRLRELLAKNKTDDGLTDEERSELEEKTDRIEVVTVVSFPRVYAALRVPFVPAEHNPLGEERHAYQERPTQADQPAVDRAVSLGYGITKA